MMSKVVWSLLNLVYMVSGTASILVERLTVIPITDSLPQLLVEPIVESVTVQIGNLEYRMGREQRQLSAEVRYDQSPVFATS